MADYRLDPPDNNPAVYKLIVFDEDGDETGEALYYCEDCQANEPLSESVDEAPDDYRCDGCGKLIGNPTPYGNPFLD